MRSCELKITTESGEGISTFAAKATFEKGEEGDKVRYRIDGDAGELAFTDASLTMCRRGKCGLQATFCVGQQTQMVLGDASLQGSIPLNTTHYFLQKDNRKISIELCYELFAAENILTYSQKIQLIFSEEQ